jgi:hypothetical protein
VLSSGQVRLRQLVAAAASTIDPTRHWHDQGAPPLKQLHATVMADALITTDAITGQNLRQPPVSRSYTRLQRYAGVRRTVSTRVIEADTIIYERAAGAPGRDPLPACSGADKPLTVLGSLTWLALGRALPLAAEPPKATLLTGSRVLICGGGGNHRTLACFLWGETELCGEITVVDELVDDELHAACRLIDGRLPNPADGIVFENARLDDHAAQRAQLLDLARRLQPLGALPDRGPLAYGIPSLQDIQTAIEITERHRQRSRLRRALTRRTG